MFRRLVWLATGVVVGWASAWWAYLRARRVVRRHVPEQVRLDATAAARRLGHGTGQVARRLGHGTEDVARRLQVDVRDALAEARMERHDTEVRLRARLIDGPRG